MSLASAVPAKALAVFAALSTATGTPTEPAAMVDPRDGQSYPVVEIAGLTWHARNLNFASQESYCYADEDVNCGKYGRLYRWEAALTACPAGWHLSTEFEWQALELAIGVPFGELPGRGNRGGSAGAQLKPGGDTGFDVAYGGWRRSEDGGYEAAGKNSAYWTAGEADLEHAWHRDVDTGDDHVFRSRVIKPYGLSIRCVLNWSEADDPREATGDGGTR